MYTYTHLNLTLKKGQLPPSYRPTASDSSSDKTDEQFPGLLVIVGTISGTILILLNVLLIGCCVHHKAKKRVSGT